VTGLPLLLNLLLLAAAALPAPARAQLPNVAVERRLAQELSLRVGDTIRLGTAPDSMRLVATVAAVYEPRPDPAEIARVERHLRMHLPDLAALLGAPDRVDRFGVGLVPGTPVDSAVAALERNAFGFRVYSSAAIAAESS
jgi:hypothetical protein